MDVTVFLARLLGVYLLLVSPFIFCKDSVAKVIGNVYSNPALLALTGALNILFGVAVVLAYPHVDATWKVVFPILGVLMVVKGLFRLYAPDRIQGFEESVKGQTYLFGVVTFVLGAFLTYVGFGLGAYLGG
jgi:hypothetical protein